MKHLFVSLLLCFCLTTSSAAAQHYKNNDWRSMPFIEMMAAMMRVMNDILAGGNSFSGMNALPYSPAFFPMANGMSGLNPYSQLGTFNKLPMSPAGFNTFQNNGFSPNNTAPSSGSGNFWDLDAQNEDSAITTDKSDLNGIWQSLSGDVIAIYNNNRFLWSDGMAKNLAGQLVIKGNNMIAYVPAKKITLYFQFYMEPGQFVVRDRNSRIYTFKRIH